MILTFLISLLLTFSNVAPEETAALQSGRPEAAGDNRGQSPLKEYGAIACAIDITNTGNMAGDEVVQVYIRDLVASTARPRKQLCAFRRVNDIPAGHTVTVNLPLPRSAFELVNPAMQRVVEPGEFEIQVGASSDDIRLKQTILYE